MITDYYCTTNTVLLFVGVVESKNREYSLFDYYVKLEI